MPQGETAYKKIGAGSQLIKAFLRHPQVWHISQWKQKNNQIALSLLWLLKKNNCPESADLFLRSCQIKDDPKVPTEWQPWYLESWYRNKIDWF